MKPMQTRLAEKETILGGTYISMEAYNELQAKYDKLNKTGRAAWMPTKEQLPESETEGLVYSPSCKKIFKAIMRNGVWLFAYDYRPIYEQITHWMPLPAAPEGDRDGR